MVAIIFIGLYVFGAVIMYFATYAIACYKYRKEKPALRFKYWIEKEAPFEDRLINSVIWPIVIFVIVLCKIGNKIENLIKKWFNIL